MNRFPMILISLVLLMFVSCKDEPVDTEPQAPDLPDVSTMKMDFSFFNSQKSHQVNTYVNWAYSALNVGIFSGLSSGVTAIPAMAFGASFGGDPTYLGDFTWEWKYSLGQDGVQYSTRLTGKVVEDKEVEWKMYASVSGNDGFTDFKWFEGTTTDSTKAEWTLYESPEDPSPVIEIEWEKDDGTATLSYHFVRSESENSGSKIVFGINEGADYDRHYQIDLKTVNGLIDIEWNSVEQFGRVKSPGYFSDLAWHCWDKNQKDIVCGE